jgi:hypothetical protein
MAEEGLEVPENEHRSGALGQWVAIFTALLAALGAVVGYHGNQLMHEVLLKKNEAVLKKAAATNEWNYYQAASTKAHLMELAQQLVPAERAAQFDEKLKKYATQKDELQAKAHALDEASEHVAAESERLEQPHGRLAMAMIFLQIAISIASVTALTQRAWLLIVAFASAAGGVGLWMSVVLGAG